MRFAVDISDRVYLLISVPCVRSCEEFDINLLEIVNTCLGLTMTLDIRLELWDFIPNVFLAKSWCVNDSFLHKTDFYDNIMTLSDLAEFVNNISAKPRPGTTGGGGETGLATVGRFGRNDIIYCGIISCLYFWLLKLWIMTPVQISCVIYYDLSTKQTDNLMVLSLNR